MGNFDEDFTIKESQKDQDVLTYTASTLGEFCDIVDNITHHWRLKASQRQKAKPPKADLFPGELSPWFRGITQESYECEPTLLREINKNFIWEKLGCDDKERIVKIEDYFLQRFITFGSPHLKRIPEKKIHWFFLMQHHGVPTRLLDWSKSSFMALFFAIRKYQEKEIIYENKTIPNAAIWMLEPRRLSEVCHKTRSIYGANISDHIDVLDNYLNLSNNAKERDRAFPIPLIPDLVSPRITSQVGRFTFHTDRRNKLIEFANNLYNEKKIWYLVKIIIPASEHRKILRSIRVAGISFMNIKEDLDGVAEELKWRMRLGVDDHNTYKNLGSDLDC